MKRKGNEKPCSFYQNVVTSTASERSARQAMSQVVPRLKPQFP